MNEVIRVLLVDDHMMFRMGIRSVLAQAVGIEVIGEAANRQEAIKLILLHRPDVTILDLRMPDGGGLAVLNNARELMAETRFLVLSSYANEEEIYRALRAGARGYLLKDVDGSRLIEAVRTVFRGVRDVSASIDELFRHRDSMPSLTPREIEVLSLLVKGLTSKEISRILGSSVNTIRNQTSSIFAKLEVTDRAEAATVALQRGLIPADE